MKNGLRLTGALLLLLVAGCAVRLTIAASALMDAWAKAPAGISAQLTAMQGSVDRVLPVVERQAAAIVREASKQLETVQTSAHDAIVRADLRVGDTLARVDRALLVVEGLRADVKPVLAGAAALEVDLKDSIDDLYFDVKAAVESGTVAVTSVAMASESIRAAAPKMTESVVSIGQSSAGIAADVHSMTSDFARPKTFWQRVKSWIELGGKLGIRLL